MFALKALAPHKYNPPKETINLLELDPDLLTSAQLDRLLDHLLVKMVGNDPVALEEARREMLAGPVPIGTPASRVVAAERLQTLLRRLESIRDLSQIAAVCAELGEITRMFAAPATAITCW